MQNKDVVAFLKGLAKNVKDGSIQVNLIFMDTKGKMKNALSEGKAGGKKKSLKRRLKKRGRKKLDLPADRSIYQFLHGKQNGETLSSICSQFKIKKDVMMPKLGRMVKREDLAELKGRYFLIRRVRNIEPGKRKAETAKAPPIQTGKLLDCLKKQKEATLPELAKKMGEASFHRLIKPINKLIREKKVCRDDKIYRLA